MGKNVRLGLQCGVKWVISESQTGVEGFLPLLHLGPQLLISLATGEAPDGI